MMNYYIWYNTIDSIPENVWNNIFPDKILKSYKFFKVMEESNIPNCTYCYLCIYQEEIIVSIIPCFTYRLDLLILTPIFIKNIGGFFRKFFPNFLQTKILGLGSIASTCEQHIGVASKLDNNNIKLIKEIITEQVKCKSREFKCKLVLIKEVPESQLEFTKKLFSNDFHFYYSLPQCVIPIISTTTPYPIGLKRKQNQRFVKLTRRFDERYYWERVDDFANYADVFNKLYFETLKRSSNIFEILNKEFFLNLNKAFNNQAFMLIAKNLPGKIEAIGLVLEEEDSLIPLYLGLNYDNTTENMKLLHANSIFRVIQEAEHNNKKFIKIGQTSYYPKVLSGALVENLYLGFYSYNKFLNFIIKTFFANLFPKTSVIDNIYKSTVKEMVVETCSKAGMHVCN